MRNFLLFILIFSSIHGYSQSEKKLMQAKMKALDEYLNYAVVNSEFSGQVLVTGDHHIWIDKGYGIANREENIEIDEETVFDIGEVSAQFTVAAILMLEQEGKLRVVDNIGKFLDAPNDKSNILIHNLITHTAGFKEKLGDEYEVVSRMDFISQAMESELLFSPGERYSKSYIGYALLAAIIEIVSGQSYEEYLEKHLFDKAQMSQTGFLIPKFSKKDMAVGYAGAHRWGLTTDHVLGTKGASWYIKGSAGFLSTATDLYHWYDAIFADEILWPDNVYRLFLPQVNIDDVSTDKFCYGWISTHSEIGGTSIMLESNNNVFASRFQIYLDSGVVIVLLTNAYNNHFEEIFKVIEQHAFH